MKKKIIISLALFSLIFLASGLYISTTIDSASDKMTNLVRLHQIEILRERLQLEIKRTQTDLSLKNTRYENSLESIVDHVRSMSNSVNKCLECHHEPIVRERLVSLREQVEAFKTSISRVFTLRANKARMEMEQDNAYQLGLQLLNDMSLITSMTSQKLEARTLSAFAEVTKTRRVLYTLLFTTPLVVLILAIVFLQGFTRPVKELLTATRHLKSGELDYRVPKLHDEYGEVGESINEMSSSLKEQYLLNMQWAEQLFLLGEMSGGLAHEIKNPLAGVKALLEVLSTDAAIPAEDQTLLKKSIEQIKKIEALLKSLLNFARPPKPQLTSVDVNSVLEATISLAQRLPVFASVDGKGVKIVKFLDPRIWAIMADPLQLQQVFINLIVNAAEAMPQGGMVTVRSSYDVASRSLQIAVSDTGEGVDPGMVDKIFQPFFTTKSKGTGLGLAITKRLIEQHGGTIRAENNRDWGATFLVTLPVKQQEVSAL
jgi:signal transduction histidine kinase